MVKRLDLKNQRFGKLIALEFVKHPIKAKNYGWKCQCDCGNISEFIDTNNLTSGRVKSCGCIRNRKSSERLKNKPSKNKLESGEGSMSCLINSYRYGAKKRGFDYNLTRDEFREITKGVCFHCGIEPKQIMQGQRTNGPYVYNGIDRLDSKIGYNISNCVPCCNQCNTAKLDHNYGDFLDWVERLANNLLEKGDIQLEERVYKKLEKL